MTDFDDSARELIEYIARQLTDEPDLVEVDVFGERNAITVELRVSPNDMGRVIGRGGRVANAMRTLLKAASQSTRRRINLEIM